MRSDFEKASCYIFNGDSIQVLNSRRNDGSVLMEMKVYNPEYDISENEAPAVSMGGM